VPAMMLNFSDYLFPLQEIKPDKCIFNVGALRVR
jgi:hypothetical protein